MKTLSNIGKITSYYTFINEENIIRHCKVDGNRPEFDIFLYDIGIACLSSYGQYKMKVQIKLNNEMYIFKKHSTDSEMYDELCNSDNLTENRKKELLTYIFEEVMEDNKDQLEEIIFHIQEK